MLAFLCAIFLEVQSKRASNLSRLGNAAYFHPLSVDFRFHPQAIKDNHRLSEDAIMRSFQD